MAGRFAGRFDRLLPPWERPPRKMLLAFCVALGLVIIRLADGLVSKWVP